VIVSVTISDNRESVIGDAIKSVVDHVDRVLLVDTGITDGTIERAREVAGSKLLVVKHTWANDFSFARNVGLATAKAMGADWIVILDSDERFRFGSVDLRSVLANIRADAVWIESFDSYDSYIKDKFVRASSSACYVGPTHEVLRGGTRATLSGVAFFELPKTEEQLNKKFKRDVELLTEYVAKHPNDGRWWYYLGMSHEGLGEHHKAVIAYGNCVALRKIGDEAAWAAYKQADQLVALKLYEDAIRAAARGIGASATSAECAWIAAVAARHLKRNDFAVAWARIAEAVGRYKGCGPDRLHFRFLPALYELPYDILRSALTDPVEQAKADADYNAAKLARLGAKNDRDLDRMGVTRLTPNRYDAREMLRPLPLSNTCPSARSSQILFEPPNGFHPLNPSICWHNGELWCVVRTVNYTITGKKYKVDDPDGITRTENYLGRLSPDVELIGAELMRDLDTAPRKKSKIVGYEDVRLVSVVGGLAAGATVCDRDPDRRLMARLHLNDDGDVVQADVQPSNQQHEKNWLPLSVNGEFTWIYSLDPTAILPGPLRSCPFALEHLRGGAAIAFKDGYLCIMHESIDTNEGRIYLHRFVRLDARFIVTAVSPAWVFAHHGIEFCAGMALDDHQLLISYGLKDQEAWIMQVDVAEVEAMGWITS